MTKDKYLNKEYPYEKEARFFFSYHYGLVESDDVPDIKHYIQKQGLTGFGKYLESRKIIFPVKEDVIQFVLHHIDKPLQEISWVIDILNEFIKYCDRNRYRICNRAFIGVDIDRDVQLFKKELPSKSEVRIDGKPYQQRTTPRW